jgi:hypothetical protein
VPLAPEELQAVEDRSYPADWVDAVKMQRDAGYELLQAAVAVLARVSVAVARRYCCSFVIHAGDGQLATGTVEFFRPNASSGAIRVRQGALVGTADGRVFRTTADIDFGGAQLGPISVAVEATAKGYEWNVGGQVTTAGGEALPGDIDHLYRAQVVDPVTGEPKLDLGLSVMNLDPTSGGSDRCLDGLGQDRGIARHLGETEEQYRYRILTTPDAVSPDAIVRAAEQILAPLGLGVCLREVGTPLLPGIFYDAGSSHDSPQLPFKNFAYDMDFSARPDDRFKVMLASEDFRAFFLLGVPKIVLNQYPGLLYGGVSNQVFSPKNAYDTTQPKSPNAAYDGFTVLDSGTYKAIFSSVKERKAGGVGFQIYLEELGCF